MPICNDVMKKREIRFARSGIDQPEKAMKLLAGVEGIENGHDKNLSLELCLTLYQKLLESQEQTEELSNFLPTSAVVRLGESGHLITRECVGLILAKLDRDTIAVERLEQPENH